MKLKDKLLEIAPNTFVKIVGLSWDISVKNPDKEFKTMFKDILDKDVKSVKLYKESGIVVIDV